MTASFWFSIKNEASLTRNSFLFSAVILALGPDAKCCYHCQRCTRLTLQWSPSRCPEGCSWTQYLWPATNWHMKEPGHNQLGDTSQLWPHNFKILLIWSNFFLKIFIFPLCAYFVPDYPILTRKHFTMLLLQKYKQCLHILDWFLSLLWDRVSLASLELKICLPLPSKCWGHRCVHHTQPYSV